MGFFVFMGAPFFDSGQHELAELSKRSLARMNLEVAIPWFGFKFVIPT
jgi:hypothetical protein